MMTFDTPKKQFDLCLLVSTFSEGLDFRWL